MVKKGMSIVRGIKGTTQFAERLQTPHKRHQKPAEDERIKICLNCTKPARECKGKCFGGV